MTYDKLSKEIEQLSYRDKFRLAQLLIQLARKEEEEAHPERRQTTTPTAKLDPDLIQYVADRLRKLKPSKKEKLFNSIGAMFQFKAASPILTKRESSLSCIRRGTSTLERTVASSTRKRCIKIARQIRRSRLNTMSMDQCGAR